MVCMVFTEPAVCVVHLGMRTFESVAVFSNGFLCFVVACRE